MEAQFNRLESNRGAENGVEALWERGVVEQLLQHESKFIRYIYVALLISVHETNSFATFSTFGYAVWTHKPFIHVQYNYGTCLIFS